MCRARRRGRPSEISRCKSRREPAPGRRGRYPSRDNPQTLSRPSRVQTPTRVPPWRDLELSSLLPRAAGRTPKIRRSASLQPPSAADNLGHYNFALKDITSEPRRGHRSLRYLAMHILIVEDDEVARDYLAKALRQAGHTVDVAGNGLEGLHMASSIAVDLDRK